MVLVADELTSCLWDGDRTLSYHIDGWADFLGVRGRGKDLAF